MTTTTRCCSCSDEIAVGSGFWHGAHEDERACSMLCRYRSIVESTNGWKLSSDSERAAGLTRVLAAKGALLHDPEIFDQEGVLVVTVSYNDQTMTRTAAMISLKATGKEFTGEILDGDWEGEETVLDWEEILDMVLRDA